jgi:hypothetical protein
MPRRQNRTFLTNRYCRVSDDVAGMIVDGARVQYRSQVNDVLGTINHRKFSFSFLLDTSFPPGEPGGI